MKTSSISILAFIAAAANECNAYVQESLPLKFTPPSQQQQLQQPQQQQQQPPSQLPPNLSVQEYATFLPKTSSQQLLHPEQQDHAFSAPAYRPTAEMPATHLTRGTDSSLPSAMSNADRLFSTNAAWMSDASTLPQRLVHVAEIPRAAWTRRRHDESVMGAPYTAQERMACFAPSSADMLLPSSVAQSWIGDRSTTMPKNDDDSDDESGSTTVSRARADSVAAPAHNHRHMDAPAQHWVLPQQDAKSSSIFQATAAWVTPDPARVRSSATGSMPLYRPTATRPTALQMRSNDHTDTTTAPYTWRDRTCFLPPSTAIWESGTTGL